jgi:hypothetical protein
MYDYLKFDQMPTSFVELIDQQTKFYKDVLDQQAKMLKAVFDVFQPKKA